MSSSSSESISFLPSTGVLKPVLVVKGHEEPKDGEEHDDVSRENEARGAPLDDVVAVGAGGRAGEDQRQGKGGEDDASGQKVAELKGQKKTRL